MAKLTDCLALHQQTENNNCLCSCESTKSPFNSKETTDAVDEKLSKRDSRHSKMLIKVFCAFIIPCALTLLIPIYIRGTVMNNAIAQYREDFEEELEPEGGIRPWPIMANFEGLRKDPRYVDSPEVQNDSVFPDPVSNALSIVRVNVRIHKPPQLADEYIVRRNIHETNQIEAQQALRLASEIRTRLEASLARNRGKSASLAEEAILKARASADEKAEEVLATDLEPELAEPNDHHEHRHERHGAHSYVRWASSVLADGHREGDHFEPVDEAFLAETQRHVEKMRKLLEHAYVLDPESSDVLTALGSFFEVFDGDWVKAEHLYARALTHDPAHRGALASRARCLPIVAELDQRRFNRIDTKLQRLFTTSSSFQHAAASLARTSRERYVRLVYHNNAIEGNSLTLIQTRVLLETRVAIGGKSLLEQNEVLGLDAALMFINSTLLRRTSAIRLSDILELHRRVLGFVDVDQAGRLRDTQVFVGSYRPPPANELPALMRELVEWLNSAEAQALHPIELAALAHWKLVYVHPFYDGNGRTARLLANWLLMRSGFPPIIVPVQERYKYYRMIELANDGDVRPFIRFIASLAERAIDEFIDGISSPAVRTHADFADAHTSIGTPDPDEILRELDDPDAGTILVDTYQREQVDPKILDFVGG